MGTPATCAPPAGAESGTWHWLENNRADDNEVVRSVNEWGDGRWRFGIIWHGPSVVAELGWRYHSRVPEPDEVEALRKVARAALDEGSVEIASVMETIGLIDEDERLTPFGKRALGVEG